MRVALLPLCLALCAGCTCSRIVVNPGAASADTAWIVPGRTTFAEVTERLGFPPPSGRVDAAPTAISADALHWRTLDTRRFQLKFGYIVSPIFRWSRTVASEDLLIRFDAAGRVSLVSRVRQRGDAYKLLDFRRAGERP